MSNGDPRKRKQPDSNNDGEKIRECWDHIIATWVWFLWSERGVLKMWILSFDDNVLDWLETLSDICFPIRHFWRPFPPWHIWPSEVSFRRERSLTILCLETFIPCIPTFGSVRDWPSMKLFYNNIMVSFTDAAWSQLLYLICRQFHFPVFDSEISQPQLREYQQSLVKIVDLSKAPSPAGTI